MQINCCHIPFQTATTKSLWHATNLFLDLRECSNRLKVLFAAKPTKLFKEIDYAT
jgi:hypothetical protein